MSHSSSRRRQPEVTMSDHTTPGQFEIGTCRSRTRADNRGGGWTHLCSRRRGIDAVRHQAAVFRSGSMSPEITTGSLASARTVPATDLSVGDIVSVVNGQGTRITHRVYQLDQQAGNSFTVTRKGDANAKPDVEPYFVTRSRPHFLQRRGPGLRNCLALQPTRDLPRWSVGRRIGDHCLPAQLSPQGFG